MKNPKVMKIHREAPEAAAAATEPEPYPQPP
jgi:hypothetical protein